MHNSITKPAYSSLIEIAISILEHPASVIRKKFPEREIHVHTFETPMGPNRSIEIRFEEIGATLSANYQEQNTSQGVHVFFDDTEEVFSLSNYLNAHYEYNTDHHCWKISDCDLFIIITGSDTYISICPEKILNSPVSDFT